MDAQEWFPLYKNVFQNNPASKKNYRTPNQVQWQKAIFRNLTDWFNQIELINLYFPFISLFALSNIEKKDYAKWIFQNFDFQKHNYSKKLQWFFLKKK